MLFIFNLIAYKASTPSLLWYFSQPIATSILIRQADCAYRFQLFSYYCSRLLATTPTSQPKSRRTWFTLSNRRVAFPCSASRINRRPTPAFSASSGCVMPSCLRFSFKNVAICVVVSFIVYPFGCKYREIWWIYTFSGVEKLTALSIFSLYLIN